MSCDAEDAAPVATCNVQVTSFTAKNWGGRHDNEDRCMWESDTFEPGGVAFHTVGVLDGHDTAAASDRVSKLLPGVVARWLKEGRSVAEAYTAAMAQCEDNLKSVHASAGTCVLSCTLAGNHVWCANLGDCRAGLFSLQVDPRSPDGEEGVPAVRKVPKVERLIWLSHDHKASDPRERRRIIEAGGQVIDGRVEGLEPCRTLGDFDVKAHVKKGVISIVPEVRRAEMGSDLCASQAILVCATDGVWDVLSGQEICDLIAARKELLELQATIHTPAPVVKPLRELAVDLVQFAVAKGSRDDCTAVVAMISTNSADPEGEVRHKLL